MSFSSSIFPPQSVSALEREAEPRGYARKLAPSHLILALIKAFVLRMPSLEAMGRAFAHTLGTASKSTISYALRRLMVLKVVKAMSNELGQRCRPGRASILIIDSMAVTMPRTQRSDAAKFNNHTVGMGVLWQFCVNAPAGSSPVRILKTMRGAWNDSCQIRDCALEPDGPIYVMDRGFWSLVTAAQWLKRNVRFVVRAKAQQCHYRIIRTKGAARKAGNVEIIADCVAVVGKDSKTQVKVRLVWCQTGKKDLILVSSELEATADELLAIYKQRWAIERFHKVVKHVLGLAHLYSFQANGLELLVHVAFLLAALIYLAHHSSTAAGDLIKLLRSVIRQIRTQLDIIEWKPNICTHKWRKKAGTNH